MGKLGKLRWATTSCAAVAMMMPVAAFAQTQTFSFDIPAQDLGAALRQFARVSHEQVSFNGDLVRGKTSTTLKGTYSAPDGLAVLLRGSGLTVRRANRGVLVIERAEALRPAPQSTSAAESVPSLGEATDSGNSEIVVTGTNIRGAETASPLTVYRRSAIDATGAPTASEFIAKLPQNFSGGLTEGALNLQRDDSEQNQGDGNALNLRGLGSDSTLVLLNGHRVAPGGGGTFVDVSMFPLTALSRIDVLTDGASAIYGSDAVGGVVNFVLRKDYQGQQTSIRYGNRAADGGDEIRASQLFGRTWATGHLLASYEFYSRDDLDVSDQPFTSDIPSPSSILPRQRRHSVVLDTSVDPNESLSLFATGLYSHRTSRRATFILNRNDIYNGNTDQFTGTAGASLDFGSGWSGSVSSTYSVDDLATNVITTFSPRAIHDRSNLWSADAVLNGAPFAVPGGDAKLALGGTYRRERFHRLTDFTSSEDRIEDNSRSVYAAFAEFFVPIVSSVNARPGLDRLSLSAAVRYEHYSDFGSTLNPKFGVTYAPLPGFSLRSTYGKSFRAPLLRELITGSNGGALAGLDDPSSPTGRSIVAILSGNNADLKAEKATTWTIGVDVTPVSTPGLTLSFTYFDINFRNRIAVGAEATDLFFSVLADPERYAGIIDRNPDPAFLASLTGPNYSNFTSFPGFGPPAAYTDATVILDGRLRNLSTQSVRGLDGSLAYKFSAVGGDIEPFFTGTFLFDDKRAILPGEQNTELVDTVFNPVDFKARAGINYTASRLAGTLSFNYVDGYRDNFNTPNSRVRSWLTTDLYLKYDLSGVLGSAKQNAYTIAFSATNLTNRKPPYFNGSSLGIPIGNYDPTNASPVGRVISVELTANW